MGCLFLHPLVIIELCSKDDCTHVVGSSLIPNAKERRSARFLDRVILGFLCLFLFFIVSGVGILIWIVMGSRMNGNPLSVLYLRVERVTGRTGFSSYSSDTQPKQPVVKTHPLVRVPLLRHP